ncbi:MAG: Crp/Fnr family transcriptional regulator [Bacteroidetes bacterium]|nr:Crp/Fnr family transcriptional regulator [Bacteroidota bacterium]
MTHPQNTSCEQCPNVNCFIRFCSPEWVQLIGEKKSESFYHKGQQILTEGHPIFGLYFIKNGKVKVTASDAKGKEQIVRLASDGHILGHRGYGAESYPIGATAMDDSIICFIDNNTLYEAFMKNPTLTFKLMMFYSQELRGVENRIKYMAQMTVHERVVFALLYLKEIFGYTLKNVLNVNIRRKDIAALSGTSAEEVVRSLTELEEKKLIAKDVRKIRITNEKKLQEMIEMYR